MEEDIESNDNAASDDRNLGTQPIDALMNERGMVNHDLVATCVGFLNHKAVQRARKGRRLTKNTQQRVLTAFNDAIKARGEERVFALGELFNYKA